MGSCFGFRVLVDGFGVTVSRKPHENKEILAWGGGAALTDPGGGARAPPDPQIWRPQCIVSEQNNEF